MLNSEALLVIATKANVTSNDVILVLDALADLLKETVHDKGEAVSIRGLGTFKVQLSSGIIKLVSNFNVDNEEKTSV